MEAAVAVMVVEAAEVAAAVVVSYFPLVFSF